MRSNTNRKKWAAGLAILTASSAGVAIYQTALATEGPAASGLSAQDSPVLDGAIVLPPHSVFAPSTVVDPRHDSDVWGYDPAWPLDQPLWDVSLHHGFSYDGARITSFAAFGHGSDHFNGLWEVTVDPYYTAFALCAASDGKGCVYSEAEAYGDFFVCGFPSCGNANVNAQGAVRSDVYGSGAHQENCGYDWDFERQPRWWEGESGYWQLYNQCREERYTFDYPIDADEVSASNTYHISENTACRQMSPLPYYHSNWFCEGNLPETSRIPPQRPVDAHWTAEWVLTWTDNSTREDGWRVYNCDGSGPVGSSVGTNAVEGTGGTFSWTVPGGLQTVNTRGCYKVAAYNVWGISSYSTSVEWWWDNRGYCGASPCGHNHPTVALRMFASKPTEGASVVQFNVRNTGSNPAYNIDIFDNLFVSGVIHRYGPFDLQPGEQTGFQQTPIDSTKKLVTFWAGTWEPNEHWMAITYYP